MTTVTIKYMQQKEKSKEDNRKAQHTQQQRASPPVANDYDSQVTVTARSFA